MSKISTDGKPIALTLVPAEAFTALADAARQGFVELGDKRKLSGAEYLDSLMTAPESVGAKELVGAYFAGNAAVAAGSAMLMTIPVVNLVAGAAMLASVASRGTLPLVFAGKIGLSLIIANGLKGALRQTDYLFVRGNQTGYPALVDPKELQPPQNACVIDGHTSIEGMDTPLELYGVGCYRFEKDRSAGFMGVFGTSGALAFTSDDPATNGKTLAVAWHIPEKLESGKPSCGVTADLTGSYKSLQDFYEATAGASSAAFHQASSSEWRVDASLATRQSVSTAHPKPDASEQVLTLSIQQGQQA